MAVATPAKIYRTHQTLAGWFLVLLFAACVYSVYLSGLGAFEVPDPAAKNALDISLSGLMIVSGLAGCTAYIRYGVLADRAEQEEA